MSDEAVTEKLFWTDPYRTSLQTRVAAAEGDTVRLEQTIFYAESGGQESDHGSIGGHAVLAAQKAGRDIIYTLGPGHGLKAGDAVEVAIDWPRRYRLMRLHFAAEIILELVYRRFPGIAKTGAHIAAEKARIDFAQPEPITPHLPALQAEAAAIIAADLPIESAFSDAAAERRYWKIDGFAAVPCGGTHLKQSGEVGPLALKRVNLGKGRERVEIRLAEGM